jgi:hypothetical protein
MKYMAGQLVEYNGSTHTIHGVKTLNQNGQEIQMLHVRNLITDDMFWLDSSQVRLIDNNRSNDKTRNSFDDFEESSNEAEFDLFDNKTEVLNGLFKNISNENTEEFFGGLDDTMEISNDKLEKIFEEPNDSTTKSSITKDYVQNFSIPRSSVIQPRGRSVMNSEPVDATFSDLEIVGSIPTREHVKDDLQKLHEPTQIIRPTRRANEEVNAFANEKPADSINDFNNAFAKAKESNGQPAWNAKPIEENNDFKFADDISRLIKEDATDVQQIIEPGFSESSEDDFTITSETKKILLKGLSSKANKFKEKQGEILATGPINPERLLAKISKQDEPTSVLEEMTNDALEKGDSTDSVLESFNENPENIINKSKIYGSFKKMSGWFITLVVFLIFVPLIGVAVKIAGNFAAGLEKPMSIANIFAYGFDISTTNVWVLTTFISTIMVLIATPAILLTTIIYGTIYIVLTMKRQYRRLAYFNYQIQRGSNNVEALQDFSNESSAFMIKLHQENKEMKKQIKKLSKLSGINMMKGFSSDQKEVH